MAKKDPVKADIENRFAFHPATATTGAQHDAVRADLGRLAQKMAKTLPDGREKSLVLTKLEEAMFWANAAIARHDAPAAAETPQPSGPTSTEQGTDVQTPPAARRRRATIEKHQAKATASRRVARRSRS